MVCRSLCSFSGFNVWCTVEADNTEMKVRFAEAIAALQDPHERSSSSASDGVRDDGNPVGDNSSKPSDSVSRDSRPVVNDHNVRASWKNWLAIRDACDIGRSVCLFAKYVAAKLKFTGPSVLGVQYLGN